MGSLRRAGGPASELYQKELLLFINNFFIRDKLSYIYRQKLKEHFPFLICCVANLR